MKLSYICSFQQNVIKITDPLEQEKFELTWQDQLKVVGKIKFHLLAVHGVTDLKQFVQIKLALHSRWHCLVCIQPMLTSVTSPFDLRSDIPQLHVFSLSSCICGHASEFFVSTLSYLKSNSSCKNPNQISGSTNLAASFLFGFNKLMHWFLINCNIK